MVDLGTASSSSVELAARPEPLRWRSWPLRDEPLISLLIVAAVAGLSWLCWQVTNPAWTAAAVAVQVLALWRWWTPAAYEINSQGIHVRLLGRERRLPWNSIGSATPGERGVFLSPADAGDWFWKLRGWHLPWCGQRDAVLAALDFYLSPAQRDG